jgi:glycosyltransferase involved in cell wall biosynthesis
LASVLILIGGHLCTAPRPQKEAEALAAAGHEVMIRGVWFDPELAERDRLLLKNSKARFKPFVDSRKSFNRVTHLRVRLRTRVARELFSKFGFFTPDLLGYGLSQMLAVARRAKADLTIVHSEGGLWVGRRLLEEGYKVGVDFEDWFSEDLLPESRVTRPINELKKLEERLARECVYSLTTSQSLSKALADAYQAPKPAVVYNVFPFAERERIDRRCRDRREANLPSLHWFSQTIGRGRGLEILFKALPHLQMEVEVHLRGECDEDCRRWIESMISVDRAKYRIFIHATVPNDELLSRIAEHDIGLALEYTDVPSRNLSVTNKLFQYLQAGLAVIATDTAGQREVMQKCPAAGQLIPADNPMALASALNELISRSGALAAAKAASIAAAENEFCWEKQSSILLEASEHALARPAITSQVK